LDEEDKIASLVWSYDSKSLYTRTRGSAQRLQNGNTLIGWGGTGSGEVPAVTEINMQGEKVFELYFDPTSVVSYRAFRFPFPDGRPSAEVILTELASGGSYHFQKGDTVDTGITIEINEMDGDGYNEITAKKYSYGPYNPQFLTKAPMVIPQRIVVSEYAINSIDVVSVR